MFIKENKAYEMKIAYIGGGSRGWAWGLMSDLAQADDLHGEVALYDIDMQAAKNNEIIGNKIPEWHKGRDNFKYKAAASLKEALTGADFVVISILPGTFDEMESDVHTPEKYGIYQSVGDTVGPGGVVRALRTIPMFETIANAIKDFCPKAWVINYTNPMTVCVRTLYSVFPNIKAFGCCHEVFGTQKLLARILGEQGYGDIKRSEIKVNVVGINHFTWITSAHYKNVDIFPIYREFCANNKAANVADDNWMNNSFKSLDMVKMELFRRYGIIAAAGDRHLAEFCPGAWFLKDPDTVEGWGFHLTTVDWRKNNLVERLEKSRQYLKNETDFVLKETGEDGVKQMRAILGLSDLVTNVNLPNVGQISNLPLGAVVETNAYFTSDSVIPVVSGEIPESVNSLIARHVFNQECIVKAARERDLEQAFNVFMNDPLVTIDRFDGRKLFDEMIENTKEYLKEYF